jgi:hypothetical protein
LFHYVPLFITFRSVLVGVRKNSLAQDLAQRVVTPASEPRSHRSFRCSPTVVTAGYSISPTVVAAGVFDVPTVRRGGGISMSPTVVAAGVCRCRQGRREVRSVPTLHGGVTLRNPSKHHRSLVAIRKIRRRHVGTRWVRTSICGDPAGCGAVMSRPPCIPRGYDRDHLYPAWL